MVIHDINLKRVKVSSRYQKLPSVVLHRLWSVGLSKVILKSSTCCVLSISQGRDFQKSIIHPVKLLFLLDLSEFSHSTLLSASWAFLTCCL